jgi:hypothetical protein
MMAFMLGVVVLLLSSVVMPVVGRVMVAHILQGSMPHRTCGRRAQCSAP